MNRIQCWYRKGLLSSLCFSLFLGGCSPLVVDTEPTPPDKPTPIDSPSVEDNTEQKSRSSEEKGRVISFKPDKDKLYKKQYRDNSYALLIGVSDYTAGWSDLGSVHGELEQVKAVLEEQDFKVFLHFNPNSRQLKNLFEDFVAKYGYISNNRLLFFFSGHGHSRDNNKKGYIVPADAPDPEQDELGFLNKAVSMTDILAWARKIEAKHALFLFDSCFSGTVFKSRSLPISPPVKDAIKLPVRQFITAGRAGNKVPAKSVFTPAFVDALKYGWGDLNQDGHILGTELGLYLHQRVPESWPRQIPQYGKIPDYELSRGDFVFFLKTANVSEVKPKPPETSTRPPEPPRDSTTDKKTIFLSLRENNKGRHFSIQPLAELYQKQGFQITDQRDEAEYVLEGLLTVTSGPPIRGSTNLRPRSIDLDIKIRSRSDNRIKYINVQGVFPHIDEFQGAKSALLTAIQKKETDLLSLP